MSPDDAWHRLARALAEDAPERAAPPTTGRVAAVLVLLEDGPEGLRLVLTRRRRDLRSHPGQIALPGGRVDADETPTEAALREAREEVGLDPSTVEVLGIGSTFLVPPSRFWVVPVLARWVAPHPLVGEANEVEAVLTVTLDELTDQRRWRHTPVAVRGGSAWAWALDGGDLLWGATALVVRRLLDVVLPGWDGGRSASDLGPARAVTPWRDAPRAPRRRSAAVATAERAQADLPHVRAADVRAVRAALAATGVGPRELVERSGARVGDVVLGLASATGGGRATVLVGPSTDGGGGLVAAERLARAGLWTTVLVAGAPRFPDLAERARAAGATLVELDAGPGSSGDGLDRLGGADVIVDALLGVGAEGSLTGAVARAADWLARHDALVIASQVPSGIAADRGLVGTCCSADVTVALGLPVLACRDPSTQAFLGDLVVADLGIPASTWAEVGVHDVPGDLFASGPVIRLEAGPVEGDAGTPLQAEERGG